MHGGADHVMRMLLLFAGRYPRSIFRTTTEAIRRFPLGLPGLAPRSVRGSPAGLVCRSATGAQRAQRHPGLNWCLVELASLFIACYRHRKLKHPAIRFPNPINRVHIPFCSLCHPFRRR